MPALMLQTGGSVHGPGADLVALTGTFALLVGVAARLFPRIVA